MNEWQNIGNNKKIKSIHEGKIVLIASEEDKTIVPLFCHCCTFPMKTSDDSISYRKHGVCNHCNERWTNKPGVSWPDGPNKTSKEWLEYIEMRIQTSKPVIIFR